MKNNGTILMEYCILNAFIGAAIVLLWHVCFYNTEDGWVDSTQQDANDAQLAVLPDGADPVPFENSGGTMIVNMYRTLFTGISMPFP